MSKIKIAIGLDVGHGESTAHYVVLRNKDGNPTCFSETAEIKALSVKNNVPKVMSTLIYRNGKADIGQTGSVMDVGDVDRRVYAYFKVCPDRWKERPSEDAPKTYGELMRDFIGHLVKSILNPDINPELRNYAKDEILLYVGCPSDQTWTKENSRLAYVKLIQEATGITEVRVVPESTAAVFSVIHGDSMNRFEVVGDTEDSKRDEAQKKASGSPAVKHRINPKNGIAIFDLGSSTADFTYISLGATLVEKSWTLGASAIERNMLHKILYSVEKKNREQKADWRPYFGKDNTPVELAIRRDHKEAWYGDNTTLGLNETDPGGYKTINYRKADKFNRLKNSEPPLSEFYILDEAFMRDVLQSMPVKDVYEKGRAVALGSWSSLCGQFFYQCKKMLEARQLPCSTVILTGGASRMDFVKPLCESVFTGSTVCCDPSPSYCVCKGLCQIAYNQFCLQPLMQDMLPKITKKIDEIQDKYRRSLSVAFTSSIYDGFVRVLSSVQSDLTVKQLQDRIGQHFKLLFNDETLTKLVENSLNRLNAKLSKTIVDASVDAAKHMYASDAIGECFTLNLDTAHKVMVENLVTHSGHVVDPEALAPVALELSRRTTTTILDVILNIIFFLVSSDTIAIWSENISNWIYSDPNKVISLKNIRKVTEKKNEDKVKERIKEKIAVNLANSVMNAQFGQGRFVDNCNRFVHPELENGVKSMIDKAIKIVALEHFDNMISD